MLKLTVLENESERKLIVEGILAGPWVAELEALWRKTRDASGNRRMIVDLSGTTVIDAGAKNALIAMAAEGAQLVASGVYTGYVVQNLMNRVGSGACRS